MFQSLNFLGEFVLYIFFFCLYFSPFHVVGETHNSIHPFNLLKKNMKCYLLMNFHVLNKEAPFQIHLLFSHENELLWMKNSEKYNEHRPLVLDINHLLSDQHTNTIG